MFNFNCFSKCSSEKSSPRTWFTVSLANLITALFTIISFTIFNIKKYIFRAICMPSFDWKLCSTTPWYRIRHRKIDYSKMYVFLEERLFISKAATILWYLLLLEHAFISHECELFLAETIFLVIQRKTIGYAYDIGHYFR